MNNQLYNVLKWVGLIALPALATFVGAVGPSYNLDSDTIVLTLTALGTLIGTLIGVSNVQYSKTNQDIDNALEDTEEGVYEFNEEDEQLLKEFNNKDN